ncbi:Sensor protein EvgS precursor [compost metagenome]|jgi:CheY-like chemotaxis protein
MGGTLRGESRQGQGSTFTLEMPLTLSVQPVACLPSQNSEQEEAGLGRKILLVEDNPVNQTVIEAMLRSLGYEVQIAVDGAQAVSQVARQRFAATLMDCRLPIIDGYEATRRIRQLPQAAAMPIIALTANALQGDRERCLSAGMNDYLAKPFKRTDLQQILQRWLPDQSAATGD